jgi:tripartite-type tricarboxylate transporter receptor subunit TctC
MVAGVVHHVLQPRLRTEVHKALSDPAFAKKLNVSGSLEALVLSPADFAKLIRDDYAKYGTIVRQLGIKIK